MTHSTPPNVNFQNKNSNSWGIINKQGVKADQTKTKAILDIEPPKNVSEIQYFIGMANQFYKFIPCSTEVMKPLTELLNSKCSFKWGPK